MGKKNTLLYLDENLVRTAKRLGLNLSEVTEVALRERILPMLSGGERQLIFGFDQYLSDLQEESRCYELPSELEGAEFRNVGPFNEFKVKFKPGINVVLGPNASGKSMMVKAIALAFGQLKWARMRSPGVEAYQAQAFLKQGKKAGWVKIHIRKTPTVKLKLGTDRAERSVMCTLLDEPLDLTDDGHKREFMEWLRRRGGQVILFTHDESFVGPSVHVVRLGRVTK